MVKLGTIGSKREEFMMKMRLWMVMMVMTMTLVEGKQQRPNQAKFPTGFDIFSAGLQNNRETRSSKFGWWWRWNLKTEKLNSFNQLSTKIGPNIKRNYFTFLQNNEGNVSQLEHWLDPANCCETFTKKTFSLMNSPSWKINNSNNQSKRHVFFLPNPPKKKKIWKCYDLFR